jgi:hypothetical protein
LRWARICSILGVLFLVFLLSYVGLAAYFAAHVSSPTGSHTSVFVAPGNRIDVSDAFNLTNPGPFPIDGLTIVSHLGLPNGSGELVGRSPAIDLPGNTVRELAINLSLPLQGLGAAAESLLVNDSTLPLSVWVNATYAGLVSIALSGSSDYGWGAPFYGLAVALGSPSTHPNGTTSIGVTLSFDTHAPIWLNGSVDASVLSSGGASCGAIAFPVVAAAHSPFSQAETVYLAQGCSPLGGSYTVRWTGSGLSVALPGGSIP